MIRTARCLIALALAATATRPHLPARILWAKHQGLIAGSAAPATP